VSERAREGGLGAGGRRDRQRELRRGSEIGGGYSNGEGQVVWGEGYGAAQGGSRGWGVSTEGRPDQPSSSFASPLALHLPSYMQKCTTLAPSH